MKVVQSVPEIIETKLMNLEYNRIKRRLGQKRWLNSISKARKYLSDIHKYQYFHGDHPIGKPMEFSGKEAKTRNKKLENKFWKELDTNPDARLGKWKWIDSEEYITKLKGDWHD